MEGQTRVRKGEIRPPPGTEPPLVLIVDDHVDSGAMAADILSYAGCWTVVVDSVDAALAEVQRERPDIVVTDIQMPYRPGVDLIDTLQSSPMTRGIPIVACTGRTDVFGRWLDEHHLRAIAKPYTPRELVDAVREAMAASPDDEEPEAAG